MRFAIRLAGRSYKEQYCGLQRIPVLDCWHNHSGDCEDCTSDGVVEGGDYENPIYTPFSEAEHVPCTKCYGTARFKGSSWWVEREIARLTQEHAIALGAKFDRAIRGRLELLVRPAGTLTVAGIEAALDRLESDSGFVPHVVISDYADIFGPESSRYDEQGNENARWLGLRRVTQERKHCHITATQADADSYTQKTLTKKNFSRDKRKLAHVTAMFGLNQTPAEKALGRLRVNEIVVREDEYDTRKCVTLIQSLKTGRPVVGSY
jgi:hypothetical protein